MKINKYRYIFIIIHYDNIIIINNNKN